MPTERCWKCHEIKRGVELCPSDDRLCPDCYQANECLLQKTHTSAPDVATAATTHLPSASSTNDAAGSSDALATANDNKKSKSKQIRSRKNKPDEPAVQPTAHPNPLLSEEQEASHSKDYVQSPVTVTTDLSAELTALRQLVSNQQSEIKRLHCQLDYVLSFLGIAEMAAESINDSPLSTPCITHPSDTHSASTDASIDSEASKALDQASWSQVVSKRQPHSHRDTLQHSVVTAVYIDQSIKKSRKACVIITGLAPVATKSDTELFTSMCASEFHIQPIISSVKRLGRQLVGKTQPLLVTLKQTDQAKQLIGSAKQLRQSSDPTTREKVYINPYLTRAEAAAAYQIRVQRRSAHQHRQERTNGTDSSDVNDGNYIDYNTDRLQNQSLSDTRRPLLNPLANNFKPSPAPTAAQAD
jgi:hypothetical protein